MARFLDSYLASEERRCPRLLGHYTKMSGAYGILQSGSARLTHYACLNDISERRYGEGVIAAVFKRLKGRSAFAQSELAELARFRKKRIDDIFVFCLSEIREGQPAQIDGTLSQWRAYADDGRGVLLAFDTLRLRASDLMRSSRTSLSGVIYDQREQQQWIETLTDAYLASLGGDDESLVRYEFATDLDVLATLIKDERFSEEKEWRVVLDNGYRSVNDPRVEVAFSDRGGTMVPFVEAGLRFAADRKNLIPLAATIVGPAVENKDLAFASLHYFSRAHAASGIVTVSKTPYRR